MNTDNLLNQTKYGAFDSLNSEYIIYSRTQKPPTPWSNIIANKNFGTLVTESGAMFTWFKNSYLGRITPRIDDPILQSSGEIIYLFDQISGETWQPTTRATVRHGKGYSVYENIHNDVIVNTTILVPRGRNLKLVHIQVENKSDNKKEIGVCYYNQLVLGEHLEQTKRYIEIKALGNNRNILATNTSHGDFDTSPVAIGVNKGKVSFCLNRSKFFGREGNELNPHYLTKGKITDIAAPAVDPCAAIASIVSIPPRGKKTLIFYIAAGQDVGKTSSINEDFFTGELEKVKEFWKNINSVVSIETPNKELDVLFNNHLLYQLISSRLWGRTGLYQPGGAFGYRDQLQDVISLSLAAPDITKEHILLAASRQFYGGSVQQWWHPPKNVGVRSKSSDAHLWLVYATIKYIKMTGDLSILKEEASYLLEDKEHQVNSYFSPKESLEKLPLINHCIASMERTLYLIGETGLPLMLSGDWNDGMDLIGKDKKGESVWMGMFLVYILEEFSTLIKETDISYDHEGYLKKASDLRTAIKEKCWDGNWFIRAFWDDGTKLGSKSNNECKIDSIAQSWSVISKIDNKLNLRAIDSANKYLIDHRTKVTKLFDPPFTNPEKDPGYIQLYPAGVRENGGAYSHAALWLAAANAKAGQGETAMTILDYMNPAKKTCSVGGVETYKGEPYAVAADIYTSSLYPGMAGWTWYTGTASLYYITALEDLLGIKVRGNILKIEPSFPPSWSEYRVNLNYKGSHYLITIKNPKKIKPKNITILVDGERAESNYVTLKKGSHILDVTII